jgi:hypothetical protein
VPCLVLCYHGRSGTVGEYEAPVLIVASYDDDDDGDAVVLVQRHDSPVPVQAVCQNFFCIIPMAG